MTYQLHVEKQASTDIAIAALEYEDQRLGLGLDFLDKIDALFARIVQSPFQFPCVEGDVRRALMPRFPYGIYFVPEAKWVVVRAVLHLHRHPDAWKR